MSAAARRSALLGLVMSCVLLTACTMQDPDGDLVEPTPTPPPVYTAELRLPDGPVTILDASDDVTLAAAASAALFASAPVAVVAPAHDVDAQLRAASIAVALGAPLLLISADPPFDPDADANGDPAADAADDAAPDGEPGADAPTAEPGAGAPATEPEGTPAPTPNELAVAELDRLGVRTVITVGDVDIEVPASAALVPAPDDDAALAELIRLDLPQRALGGDDPTGWSDVEVVAGLDRDAPRLLVLELTPIPGPTDDAEAPTRSPEASASPTRTADETAAADADTDTDPETDPGADIDTSPLVPFTELAAPIDGGLLLSTGDASEVAAVATARAAGVPVLIAPTTHPGSEGANVATIAELAPTSTIALGAAFGPEDTLEWKMATAATGVELPGGGQVLFPGRRFVAMYGTPHYSGLGILGEQDLEASITRAHALAAEYQPLTDDVVVPAFEIIVTVAHRYAGDDGNYSTEFPVESFVPWVEAALEAGVYVVIDLQPGRTDFLTQAQLYEELLLYPNVGLALDPEWRLKPNQVHLTQIGSVHVDEVNLVIDYLAELTRDNALPQKLLILHQFTLRMIEGRERVNTSFDEVAVMIHADGQGSQGAKTGTWAALHQGAPEGVWWGWKNFIDEDHPTLTPAQTYQVQPPPHFVSYQ